MNKWVKAGGVISSSLLLSVLSVLIGFSLSNGVTAQTSVGEVQVQVDPTLSGGDASLYVPVADWGFRARAFNGPVDLRSELRSLNRENLIQAASGNREVLTQAEGDLLEAAKRAVVKSVLWILAVSLILGCVAALIWRPRSWKQRVLYPAAVLSWSVLSVGVSLAWANLSFDVSEFESPTYFARGAELERLLTVAEEERVKSAYGDQFASVLRGVSTVLTDSQVSAGSERDLFLGSDLHSNFLVVDPIRRFVKETPLFLAGDFTQHGNSIETQLIAKKVAAMGREVYAVSGNHDSQMLMQTLTREGVRVLEEGDLVEIEGLTLAAWPDPLEWKGDDPDHPGRLLSFNDSPRSEELYARANEDLLSWWELLKVKPDIVAIHQDGLAQNFAQALAEDDYSSPLTILTGHDHIPAVTRYEQIVVVNGGSVGASGAFGVGEEAASFAELHFATEAPVLRSVDLIRVEPLSGQAGANRVVIEAMCPGEDYCVVEEKAEID